MRAAAGEREPPAQMKAIGLVRDLDPGTMT
jgi:hypothetical protein